MAFQSCVSYSSNICLKVPGAKDKWIKLFEDISLEEIFHNISLGGGSLSFDGILIDLPDSRFCVKRPSEAAEGPW